MSYKVFNPRYYCKNCGGNSPNHLPSDYQLNHICDFCINVLRNKVETSNLNKELKHVKRI